MDADHQNCPLTDSLMSTVDALVVIADPEGRILQFNKACESVSGYTADEVVGRSVVDVLVPEEQRNDVTNIIGDLSAPGTNRFENDWITADGRRRRIMWSNATMTDADGRIDAIIGTGIDVTDQRLLESRIAQADRLDSVGRLAAGVAHDFNNTLTSLCLRVERLAARELDSDSRTDVDAISGMIGRTQNLITELLSFSNPRQRAPERVDVNTEIERMQEVLGGLIDDDIDVEIDLTAEPTEVLIDPVGIEQAVTNFVMNARDAMPNGGRLSIRTRVETIDPDTTPSVEVPSRLDPGRYVKLSVSDTGAGIDPDDLARVFDPYFTTKASGRGTGLGLATTYATISQSCGAVTVDSEPGRGATFHVRLPLTTEDPEAVPAGGSRTGTTPGDEPCLALVVDDDHGVLESLVDELGRLGCEAITADCGERALRYLDAPIDVLVTDVQLPDIGGDEVAARFRRRRPELPVIFASGAPPARYTGLLPDDATVVRKPFTTTDLIEAIRKVDGGRWAHALSSPPVAARGVRPGGQSAGTKR